MLKKSFSTSKSKANHCLPVFGKSGTSVKKELNRDFDDG